MRWDDLFRDLEAQLAAAEAAELAAEVADRTRREAAQLGLVDRARAAVGHPSCCGSSGAGPVDGRARRVGAAVAAGRRGGRPRGRWCRSRRSCRWAGCGPGPGARLGAVRCSPGSGWVGAAGDRPGPAAGRRSGSPTASVLTGTVDRVGADFVEVAEHGPGEPRRRGEVSGVRAVPFAALALVRSGS